MGQQQYKSGEGKSTEATGSPYNTNNQKDRANAKFMDKNAVNPAYGKGGNGSKGNPGKPT